jgi:hypothetical protein
MDSGGQRGGKIVRCDAGLIAPEPERDEILIH